MNIDPVLADSLAGAARAASDVSSRPKHSTEPQPVVENHSPAPAVPATRPVEVDASYGENNVIIYRILDRDTKDLIQQIPPEQLLEIARSVREMLQARAIGTSLDVRS
jgi:hypothetical protein